MGSSVRFECRARAENSQSQDRLSVAWSKEGSSEPQLERDPRFQIQGRDPRSPSFLVVSIATSFKRLFEKQ